jgi:hypothetical protein
VVLGNSDNTYAKFKRTKGQFGSGGTNKPRLCAEAQVTPKLSTILSFENLPPNNVSVGTYLREASKIAVSSHTDTPGEQTSDGSANLDDSIGNSLSRNLYREHTLRRRFCTMAK